MERDARGGVSCGYHLRPDGIEEGVEREETEGRLCGGRARKDGMGGA